MGIIKEFDDEVVTPELIENVLGMEEVGPKAILEGCVYYYVQTITQSQMMSIIDGQTLKKRKFK